MSAREWKPGDVALVTLDGEEWHTALRCGVPSNLGWEIAMDYCKRWASGVLDARPLVTIDPEDREQVERLIRLQDKHFDGSERDAVTADDLRDMQAALREFADPQPEEPTGLGAVVIDERGMTFVRCADGWLFADGRLEPGEYRNPLKWSDLFGVRVVSEGVPS